jgi:hypothetical protein
MFGYKKGFRPYAHKSGAAACQVQAWSAASLVAVAL